MSCWSTKARALETEVDWVEGMQFDKGYLSPYFVTDAGQDGVCPSRSRTSSFTRRRSPTSRTCCRFWKRSASAGKPLLIIAEDVDGEALATLVVNKLRGTFQCCAVKAPGYGDRRKAMLEDIAILTGGQAMFESLGVKLENVKLESTWAVPRR